MSKTADVTSQKWTSSPVNYNMMYWTTGKEQWRRKWSVSSHSEGWRRGENQGRLKSGSDTCIHFEDWVGVQQVSSVGEIIPVRGYSMSKEVRYEMADVLQEQGVGCVAFTDTVRDERWGWGEAEEGGTAWKRARTCVAYLRPRIIYSS